MVEVAFHVDVFLLLEEVFEHEFDVFKGRGVERLVVRLVVKVMRFGVVLDAHADEPENEFADLDDQDAVGFFAGGVFLHLVGDVTQLA